MIDDKDSGVDEGRARGADCEADIWRIYEERLAERIDLLVISWRGNVTLGEKKRNAVKSEWK